MKNIAFILILGFSQFTYTQISGNLIYEIGNYPGAKISIVGQEDYVISDFDGNFSLSISEGQNKFDILISNLNPEWIENWKGISILIKNVDLNNSSELILGKIILPEFKSIETKEFESLTKEEKEQCRPIYHYTNLLGYEYSNELENEKLILNCANGLSSDKYEFDKMTKLISINWIDIKNCK